MKIYFLRNGEQFGPYSPELVRSYIEQGSIVKEDLGWHQGLSDWLPLDQILELDIAQLPPSPLPLESSTPPRQATHSLTVDAATTVEAAPGQWFYRERGSTRHGAGMSAADLRVRLDGGELPLDGWIWTSGMASWAPAENFPILQQRFEEMVSPPRLPPLRGQTRPVQELWKLVLGIVQDLPKVRRIWYLSMLQFIPFLGSIINRGWRLEIISRKRDDLYPGVEGVPRFITNGILLWLMYFLYLVPEFLYLLVDRFSWLFDMAMLVQYTWGVVTTGNPGSGLGLFLADVGIGFIVKSGFLLFYPIVSWPFYRVAMIRFAQERKLSVFFQFRANFAIVARSYPLIMHVYVQDKMLWVLVSLAGTLVSLTGIGALLAVGVILPIRVIVSGLLYRNLLERLTEANLWTVDAEPEPIEQPVVPGRRWFVASPDRDGLHSTPIALARVAALLAEPAASRGLVFWSPGMWRWEPAAKAAEFFERTTPPDRLPEGSSGRPFLERLKGLPREIFRTLQPSSVWKDVREVMLEAKQSAVDPALSSSPKNKLKNLAWFVGTQYVPGIATIINRGWRIDFMRSATAGAAPESSHVGRHFSEGLLLWGVYLLYLFPEFVLLALTEFKWVEQVVSLAWWGLQHLLTNSPSQSLTSILSGGVLSFLLETVVMLAYPVLTWPLYRGAMIRYALEDDLGVFFELRTNWRMAKMNFDTMAAIYLGQKTLWGFYLVCSALLAATGIGIILIPGLLNPLRLITSGVIYIRGMRGAPSMQGFFPL